MTFQMRNINAGYGTVQALWNVDMTVPSGSVVALLGANGAGKTTLLRVASGLLRPTGGDVLLDGDVLTGHPPQDFARRGVCHVPEGRGVYRSLSVGENLGLQARPGHERDAIAQAVDVFPILGRRLKQLAGTLSGGEQQMLALARSYLPGAKYVLLDEVSLGLAPRVVDEIFEFLDRLRRQDAALLLVEQYVIRALGIADYVYILNRGHVTFAGEPAELDETEVFERYTGVH